MSCDNDAKAVSTSVNGAAIGSTPEAGPAANAGSTAQPRLARRSARAWGDFRAAMSGAKTSPKTLRIESTKFGMLSLSRRRHLRHVIRGVRGQAEVKIH